MTITTAWPVPDQDAWVDRTPLLLDLDRQAERGLLSRSGGSRRRGPCPTSWPG